MMAELSSAIISPLLAALEPYADDFILIGGWVPQLYRDYGGMHWDGKLSLTTEIDAVVDATIETSGRPTLQAILTDAGLRPRPGSLHGAIWEHVEDGADALELFTPLLGPIKGPVATRIRQQAGVAAIALPDLDLVTAFVGEIRFPFGARFVRVRVPTLGAYIATKAMTFAARSLTSDKSAGSLKRGKDIMYIHDIMRAGPEVVDRIRKDLSHIAKSDQFIAGLRKAQNHLTLLRGPIAHPALADAIAMLLERDGGSPAIASAAILGSTEDLIELLSG